MNNLLFDLKSTQPVRQIKRHGGGKYGEVILGRILNRNLPVCCCYDSQKWINPDIIDLLKEKKCQLYDLNKNSLDKIVDCERIDVFYIPNITNVLDYMNFKECQMIGTVHDLRSLEKPLDRGQMGYKPWNNVYKYLLKGCFAKFDKLKKRKEFYNEFVTDNFKFVTVSNHTAYSFKCLYPEFKEVNIPVFYAPSTSVIETTGRKYNEKFFLLVSANRYYKNNLRAIKALDILISCGFLKDFRVKVTGVSNPQKAFWYKIKNIERFDFLGFVDEQELDHLYHDAYCLIYPTLQEGFGYPPLEAMHYGVPVLASPLTSIPEVLGGNAIYFNPFSVEEMMNRILQILEKETYVKYSQLARERYDLITKKQNEDLDKLIDYIYNFEK